MNEILLDLLFEERDTIVRLSAVFLVSAFSFGSLRRLLFVVSS